MGLFKASAPSTAASLREYGRGFAGGLLFSLPLLYTMEMWWVSFIATPARLTVLLAATFVLLLGYNRFAGMRHDANWWEVAIDSVEELGLGIITAALLLFLLGQIGTSISWNETIAKVVVEAAVVAIGFSVGSAELGSKEENDSGKDERPGGHAMSMTKGVVIAACGAFLIAANVAPTEEVMIIAVEADRLRLLLLAIFSVALTAAILYFVGFRDAGAIGHSGRTTEIAIGVAMTYAVALSASALLLLFFGRFDSVAIDMCARQTIVLGVPAAVGGSAGRLLLES